MDPVSLSNYAPQGPWEGRPVQTTSCSLSDVMSEQLAKQLDDENHHDTPVRFDREFDQEESENREERMFSVLEGGNHDLNALSEYSAETDTARDLMMAQMLQMRPESSAETDTASDLMLAQMLQMQFDREAEEMMKRKMEERKNKVSKVSTSYENLVHPYEDNSESVEDEDDVEDDWQEEDEPYRRVPKPPVMSRRGYVGKGKNIITKHDEAISGRKNTARVDNFAPRVRVGDELDMDLKLSNRVYNSLKQHCNSEQKRGSRLHEKKEHSTAEQAVDQRTRMLMFNLVRNGILESINGCISTGKEAVIFHADGGSPEGQSVPDEVVLKVFKTTLNEFKNRDKYIKDDYRFINHYSKFNPRKIVKLWAEKEMHNLTRMKKAGIPCPEVVLLKEHVLVMSFIGHDQLPAPKLKEAMLRHEDMKAAYDQVLHMMKLLYQRCNLVHADLSEYNMLWYDGKVWLIDVSQSVEPTHPHALEFLFRDCRNVSAFFRKRGVEEVMSEYELFNAVTELDLTVTEGADQAEFISQIASLGKISEDHVLNNDREVHRFTLARMTEEEERLLHSDDE